ncbi:MAG: hypothetical protein EAZ97_05970 [Bacteroidetes bacterium]|nr:MAG: hypothetical protein EAZ97_05970 [Bacteroidota bacterium]
MKNTIIELSPESCKFITDLMATKENPNLAFHKIVKRVFEIEHYFASEKRRYDYLLDTWKSLEVLDYQTNKLILSEAQTDLILNFIDPNTFDFYEFVRTFLVLEIKYNKVEDYKFSTKKEMSFLEYEENCREEWDGVYWEHISNYQMWLCAFYDIDHYKQKLDTWTSNNSRQN